MTTVCLFDCQTIEESLGGATTLSAPQDQVESLIRQVAAENDLEITDKLVELQPGQATLAPGASVRSEEHEKEDQLARRYRHLYLVVRFFQGGQVLVAQY